MTRVAVRIDNLSKKFRIAGPPQDNGASDSRNWRHLVSLPLKMMTSGRTIETEFWALREVSFDVAHGEVVGIIGRNGAGKSTLLKILARIIHPTCGRFGVCGRLGSLLEVGTGFHPDLTGRENVYLSGVILGMSKQEIRSRFDDIVDFAGVEKFIDIPVKRYSSGMHVRLGFAVAAHLRLDVLMVDEVLAVGDVNFQRKCMGKVDALATDGKTVMMVSHNMASIQSLCSRVILLDNGTVQFDGEPGGAVEKYLEPMDLQNRECRFEQSEVPADITFQTLKVLGSGKSVSERLTFRDQVDIQLDYRISKQLHNVLICLKIEREGIPVFSSFDTDLHPERLRIRKTGEYRTVVTLPRDLLKPGHYSVSLSAGVMNAGPLANYPHTLSFELDEGDESLHLLSYSRPRGGSLVMPLEWQLEDV